MKRSIKQKFQRSTCIFRSQASAYLLMHDVITVPFEPLENEEVTPVPSQKKKILVNQIASNIKKQLSQIFAAIRARIGHSRLVTISSTFGIAGIVWLIGGDPVQFILAVHNAREIGNKLLAGVSVAFPGRLPDFTNLEPPVPLPRLAPIGGLTRSDYWSALHASQIAKNKEFELIRNNIFRTSCRNRIREVLNSRGGEGISTEMTVIALAALIGSKKLDSEALTRVGSGEWMSYIIAYGPYAISVVASVCRKAGYTKISLTFTLISTFSSLILRANGFSINPNPESPLGSFDNPITQDNQIDKVQLPARQQDKRLVWIAIEELKLMAAFSAPQVLKKMKHYGSESVSTGQTPAQAVTRFLMGLALSNITNYYNVTFNQHFKMEEEGVVGLNKNETHNMTITFVKCVNIIRTGWNVVMYRTCYSVNGDQETRIIDEGKSQ